MHEPKKSTSVWVWVGCGCGLLLAGFIAFICFIVFVVFAAMRSAQPYQDGLQRASVDPRVLEAFGSPIEPGWFLSGSIKTENQTGTADISIPISGPKQSGHIQVTGTKSGGRWRYTTMTVIPKSGPPIDLLENIPPEDR